jgi:hypothetical protein
MDFVPFSGVKEVISGKQVQFFPSLYGMYNKTFSRLGRIGISVYI